MVRRSRNLLVLLVLLALGATGALWLGFGDAAWFDDGETRVAATASPGAPLGAESGAEEPMARRAGLSGTGGSHEAPHGPVLVRVVDRRGEAVPGVRVVARGVSRPPPAAQEPPPTEGAEVPPPEDPSRISDDLGRASFDDLLQDGSVFVEARGKGVGFEVIPAEVFLNEEQPITITVGGGSDAEGAPQEVRLIARGDRAGEVFYATERGAPGGPLLARAPVRGPEVTLAIDPGLPFHLEVVVAGDGRRAADARWEVTPRTEASADAHGGPPHVPASPGAEIAIHPVVEAIPGTVRRGVPAWITRIHPEARRLEARFPMRPEAEVLVVFPPEALPFRPEDWNAEIAVAGAPLGEPRLQWAGNGRLRVHGASHGVSEGIVIGGTLSGRWRVSGAVEMGVDPREPVVVEASLTPLPPERTGSRAGAGFTVMGSLSISSIEFDKLFGEDGGVPRGALHVQVLRPDGRPAAGAIVEVAGVSLATDATGWARYPEIGAGEQQVRVLGGGATAMRAVTVAAGGKTEVTVQPGSGAILDLEVVDAHGNPVPMATLGIQQPSGLPWIDIRDGVQRVDPFTDAAGHRRLEGVEPGHIVVHASYGNREASMEIDVGEGEVREIRLSLPPVFPRAAAPQ